MTARASTRNYGWSDVTSWSIWTAWSGIGLNINNDEGFTPLAFTSDYHDFGRIVPFVLSTNLISNGTNTIQIQTADVNPTIEASWTNRSYTDQLTSRYVRFKVTITAPDGVAPVSELFEADFQTTYQAETFNVNTSTLPGTVANRTLPTYLNYNRVLNFVGNGPITHRILITDNGSAPKVKGVLLSNGFDNDTTATITIWGLPAMTQEADGNYNITP